MKKYKIQPDVHGSFEHLYHKYRVDLEGYIEKYGFGLNKAEINEIYQHIQALEDFITSENTHALIYETIQQPDFIDNFYIPDQNNWNFVILQQKTSSNYLPQQGYSLGYKWSDMNYLVSKEGAIIILNRITRINLSFPDIILELIKLEKLSADVLKDDRFNFSKKITGYCEYRNQEILSTIFNIKRWSTSNKNRARELLKIVFSESNKLNIHLFINEGTLLGCIRHGEIMRWDDDIDLSMNAEEVKLFLESLKQNENIEIGTAYLHGKHLYYKVWLRDYEEIPGYKHRFPFIDIWPFDIVDLELQYNFGYTYHIEKIFPLSSYNFEGTIVNIPRDPISYLNNRYPGWREKIIFYPYCHREERMVGKLLQAYISVDKTGRIESKYNGA